MFALKKTKVIVYSKGIQGKKQQWLSLFSYHWKVTKNITSEFFLALHQRNIL